MVRLNSTGVRLAASLTALLVTLIAGLFILKPLFADIFLSKVPLRPELSKAISYDDKNPSHHYRLALHYYYDPSARNVLAARKSYQRAISLNPVNAMYWLGLASVYESTGEFDAARSALARALHLNPSYAKSRWMSVNLLLKEGALTKRIVNELGRIIKDFPGERARAFSVLHQVTNNNVEMILEDAIPKEFETMVRYLDFLISRGDRHGVKILWDVISSEAEIDKGLASKYINFLVSIGEIVEARRYWNQYIGAGESGSNIILNSGFEDDICDNRLCWKLDALEGAAAQIDERLAYRGKRSMLVEFDGSTNVDFRHVSMRLPLEAGRAYTLSAFMMTEGLSTTNGLFLQLYGLYGCKLNVRTEQLTGTNPWKLSSIDFTPPPGCAAALLRLRRFKSQKLDNRIRGTVRVDEVRLVDRSLSERRETDKAEGR